MKANIVGIVGTAAAAPEQYNNLFGYSDIYALWVDATRGSGTVDRVLVLFQEHKVADDTFQTEAIDYKEPGRLAGLITAGSTIEVTGQIQTYKDKKTGRVQLFIWGLYLAAVPEDSAQLNEVYMLGEIAKPPVYRETPLGRQITELAIRIPSIFAEGFYSFVPSITWEGLAHRAATLEEGTAVYIEGRIQSREYLKQTQEEVKQLTTWEVSVNRLKVRENQSNGD